MSRVVQGIDDVLTAFRGFVNSDWTAIANEITSSFEEQVYVVDAIDTGRFIRSIDWLEGEARDAFVQYLISTQRDVFVTYDGFIEFGTRFMKARYPAKLGIENADISGTIDNVVDDAFQTIYF